MTQESWPLTGSNFTDEQWRDLFGDEAGIIGDIFGTSYGYTLSPSSDVMTITASASRDSVSQVGGFGHKVVAGTAEDITIPAVTAPSPPATATRTDLIVVRCDPATYTTAPGPNRLYRIEGTVNGGTPTFDSTPPGVEDMPLYAVTRTSGQTLSQATVTDRRHWTGRVVYASTSSALGSSVPLGTLGFRDGKFYLRTLSAQGAPEWAEPFAVISNTSTLNTMGRLTLTNPSTTSTQRSNVYISSSGVLQKSTYVGPEVAHADEATTRGLMGTVNRLTSAKSTGSTFDTLLQSTRTFQAGRKYEICATFRGEQLSLTGFVTVELSGGTLFSDDYLFFEEVAAGRDTHGSITVPYEPTSTVSRTVALRHRTTFGSHNVTQARLWIKDIGQANWNG